jgi:pilus assembly protein CpaB
MNKKAAVVLTVALICALVTAVLINKALKGGKSKFADQRPKTIVVAAAKLSLGTQMKSDQLSVTEWPESLVPTGTYSEPGKLVGRVTITEILPGEPIVEARLAPEGSAAGLPAIIPAGSRAMTVKVDEVIGVAGFIAHGTFVDIVSTVNVGGANDESISRVILQNVKVLASGQQLQPQKDGQPVEVRTITLQVTPEQAEILALASNAGKLQLVMRNSVDRDTIATQGANTKGLFQGVPMRSFGGGFGGGSDLAQARTSAPVRSGPKKEVPKQEVVPAQESLTKTTTIEVIRGGERTTVTFQ